MSSSLEPGEIVVYNVKNAGLQPPYGRARRLAHELGTVTFEHVRREANSDADRLANAAMDDARKA